MEATAMIAELADKARLAARTLIAASDGDRVEVLNRIADELIASEVEILAANAKDMENAARDGMAQSMQDRLLLTAARVAGMADGAKQVSRPGQAAPRDRGFDRRRDLDSAGRGCEGRRLRGLAGEERARHQERGWPILHATSAHCGHGRVHQPPAVRACVRPGLRHGRLFVQRAPACGGPPPQPDQRREKAPERTRLCRL